MDEFIELLNIIFEFTGTSSYSRKNNPEYHHLDIKSSNNDHGYLDVIKTIYDTPLEHDVKFIHISTCGCNMEYCSAITNVKVLDDLPKTYGDVMEVVGHRKVMNDGSIIYEYPNSCWLSFQRVTADDISKRIYEEGSCNSKKVPLEISLDPNTVYLQFGYGR